MGEAVNMPIYEYKCKVCGHVFEEKHSTQEIREKCPKCKGEIAKVFSPPGISFVGSGFHCNDYKIKT